MQYLLYCSGLEPNPQYFQGLPVLMSALGKRSMGGDCPSKPGLKISPKIKVLCSIIALIVIVTFIKLTVLTIFKSVIQWHYVRSYCCAIIIIHLQNVYHLTKLKLHLLNSNSPFTSPPSSWQPLFLLPVSMSLTTLLLLLLLSRFSRVRLCATP